MTLKNLFAKPVDRSIEGVIKADDEASLRLELEEYVLTKEVEKRLEAFLDAYNNYDGANGVWVSGFFGSGKSHLLKMMALLLENRMVEGVSTLDIFLAKCGDNEILRGDLKRAANIPSKSILFNIDQKADIISKSQVDALLAVFVKVFDEMSGYYGKQAHIAQFERDLDSRGLYELFMDAYADIAGKPWHLGREQSLLEAKNIAGAYAQITDGDVSSAMGIIDKYRSQYKLSIEDFAEQINAYVQQQPENFRLNFFVDEVGQYIADNVKLMTNLQTIAESLATKCRGRAWVIVTAQEDMSTVVGEMDKQQGNDFSKIQARFSNRMKLTSADVAEVIQKRLLAKTETGINQLSDLYHAQSNNFRTLFDFADGSQTYRNYQDRDHFIHSYPFIPYQFVLFQSAIQNLSLHNAFEGKHSSVGERSMLGVFQQVAIQISDHQLGQLATFDLMFEGIRTALKSQIQRAVIQAEAHLDDAFAIKLLKALFLVKYVREFKPTLRNLCVLMLEGFNQDIPELRKRVETSLALLENESYVQRNGEQYEYLTDEEKDVEQEIKATEIDANDVAEELEKIIFDTVIKNRKIRYDANLQDYSFSRKLDDKLHGREHELSIHVISPFHEHIDNEYMLRTNSTYKSDELFVIMPADVRLMQDLLMYKRTEKYIRQNISIAQQEAVKRILTDKGFQNNERYAEIQQRVRALIAKAKLLVAGAEIEITSDDALTRINKGFHELITRSYPNLRMLRGVAYSEDMIRTILNNKDGTLFASDATNLAESEQEMLAFIQSNNRNGIRTTLKSVIENFERKPYGWFYAAVLCTLANLCARGKVEVRLDSNLLEEGELEKALRNTQVQSNLVLDPQVEFTASQVRALKQLHEDLFDAPPQSNEAKALGKETATALQELLNQLNTIYAQNASYPFLQVLKPVLDQLKELTGKPYHFYLNELPRKEDQLLDMKEQLIDPIRKFMSGPQKQIYDQARLFQQNQGPNLADLASDQVQQLSQSISDPECFKGNRMQQLKSLVDTLEQELQRLIDQEIEKAKATAQGLLKRMESMPEFSLLSQEQQYKLKSPFNNLVQKISNQTLIAVVRDQLRRFEETDYQQLLSQLVVWSQPKPLPVNQTANKENPTQQGVQEAIAEHPAPRVEYVASKSIPVSFDKSWLADEHDVENYLSAMRKALMNEIQQGKKVLI